MKGWRVFESMKWNYHLHSTTSKIRKVGMEKSLIYVWPPLSSFFLGFDTVFIEDLYLYTSRVLCHFLGPFFGRVTAKLVKSGQTYGTTVIVFFWFWVPGQKRPFVTTLIGGTSSLKKPQPDASLSIKELDGSTGAVIDFGSCSNLYRHWLRYR